MFIQYHKKAVKFINGLPEQDRLRIKTAIQNLIDNSADIGNRGDIYKKY